MKNSPQEIREGANKIQTFNVAVAEEKRAKRLLQSPATGEMCTKKRPLLTWEHLALVQYRLRKQRFELKTLSHAKTTTGCGCF